MRLRSKLLCSIGGSLLLGILLVAGICTLLILLNAPEWMNDTSDQMLIQEKNSMEQLIDKKGLFFGEKVQEVLSDLQSVVDSSEIILQNKLNSTMSTFSGTPTSHGTSDPPTPFEDRSLWYVPETNIDYALGNWSVDINSTSLLDSTFRSTMPYNKFKYLELYLGLENDLFRLYPWSNKDAFHSFGGVPCARLGADFNVPQNYYRPTCRSWYVTARQEGGQPIFTAPYEDATTGELLITAAQSVRETDGSTVGVVGFDLSIQDIQTSILGEKILQNGHIFLVDGGGSVLVHKDICRGTGCPEQTLAVLGETWYSSYIANEPGSAFSLANWHRKVFEVNNHDSGGKWFASFYDVAGTGNTTFRLVMSVPESDITAPAKEAEDDISDLVIVFIVVMVVIVVVVAIISFIVVTIFSKRVTEPVQQLIRTCQHIIDGRLDQAGSGVFANGRKRSDSVSNVQEAIQEEDSCYEIILLKRTFHALVTALRIGSRAYYGNDIRRALQSFLRALKLFESLHNVRGVAVCHNSLGSLYLKSGSLAKSQRHFERAVALAEDHLHDVLNHKGHTSAGFFDAKSTSGDSKGATSIEMVNLNADDPETPTTAPPSYSESEYTKVLSKAKSTLATRLSNFALLRIKAGNFDEAERLLQRARQLDRECDNVVLFGMHSGNLGRLYLRTKRPRMALAAFQEALQIASNPPNAALTMFTAEELFVSRQYADLNLGLVNKRLGRFDQAELFFGKALGAMTVLDKNVESTALFSLMDMYSSEGEHKKAAQVQAYLPPRTICLCFDFSGSMAGGRFRRVKENFNNIFDNQVYPRDDVSLVYFNETVTVGFPLMRKSDNLALMQRAFRNLRNPTGRTAFYDALSRCVDMCDERHDEKEGHQSSWIIALTDGDDTSSTSTLGELEDRLRHSEHLDGLIIIMYGRDFSLTLGPRLMQLVEMTQFGKLIVCQDTNDIYDAFQEVITTMQASGQIVLEEY